MTARGKRAPKRQKINHNLIHTKHLAHTQSIGRRPTRGHRVRSLRGDGISLDPTPTQCKPDAQTQPHAEMYSSHTPRYAHKRANASHPKVAGCSHSDTYKSAQTRPVKNTHAHTCQDAPSAPLRTSPHSPTHTHLHSYGDPTDGDD